MTKNGVKSFLSKIKRLLDDKVSIRRCIVKCQTETSLGWHKFAELSMSKTSNNVEVMFDVSDVYHVIQHTNGYGRLLVNIRTEGSVINTNRTGLEWVYTNGGIRYEDFVMTHNYDEETSMHKFQLWTNVRVQYTSRHFNIAYATALSTPWSDKWKLVDSSSEKGESIPSDYTQIVSAPGCIRPIRTMKYSGTTSQEGNITLEGYTSKQIIVVSVVSTTPGIVMTPFLTGAGGTLALHVTSSQTNTPVSTTQVEADIYFYDMASKL